MLHAFQGNRLWELLQKSPMEVFVLNTGREVETGFCELENLVDWGVISAAAVGRSFLANPDLIDRLRAGAELTQPDVATFYSPGPVGYTDYPTLVADRVS